MVLTLPASEPHKRVAAVAEAANRAIVRRPHRRPPADQDAS
jgi:hypothetical protein